MGLMDAPAQSFQTALHFGKHSPFHNSFFNHAKSFLITHGVDQLFIFIKDSFHIGQEDHFFGFECRSYFTGHDIGIDIESFATLADAGRRNDRNKSLLFQARNQCCINLFDFSHQSKVYDLGWCILGLLFA